jgi:hypothetical protein
MHLMFSSSGRVTRILDCSVLPMLVPSNNLSFEIGYRADSDEAAHHNEMMPPGSRASLADGFLSPAMVFGQAFLGCLILFPRMLSPSSSTR